MTLAGAETVPERLDRAQRDLQAQHDEFEKNHPALEDTNFYRKHHRGLREALRDLESARQRFAAGQPNTAIDNLHRLQANDVVSPEIRANLAAVTLELEQNPTGLPYKAEVDAVLKAAGDKVLAATDPKDLDGTIAEVQALATRYPGRPTTSDQIMLAARPGWAVNFLRQWQAYLTAKAKGNERQMYDAMQVLSNLTTHPAAPPLVSHAEILARMPPDPMSHFGPRASDADRKFAAENDAAVEEILKGTRTPDDLPAAVAKLDELRGKLAEQPAYDDHLSSPGVFKGSLEYLENERQELRSGEPFWFRIYSFEPQGGQFSVLSAHITRLRTQLLETALARSLGAPEMKPEADEAFAPFLRRLVEAAKQHGDWNAAMRGVGYGLTLAVSPGFYTPADSSAEREAYRQIGVGKNMEAAGQFQQAAVAYLHALKYGEQNLPVAFIKERLAAIQQSHSNEYADANTLVLNERTLPTPAPDTAPVTREGTESMFYISGREKVTYLLAVPALPSP